MHDDVRDSRQTMCFHPARSFGLQAEVFFFRAFGSTHGGLQAKAAMEIRRSEAASAPPFLRRR